VQPKINAAGSAKLSTNPRVRCSEMRRLYHGVQLLPILVLLRALLLASALANAAEKETKSDEQSPGGGFSPSTPSQSGNGSSSCPLGYNDCSTIGRRDTCCTLTQVCTFDSAGQVGCCEFGVKCVGDIPLKGSQSGAGPCIYPSRVWAVLGTVVVMLILSTGGVYRSVII